MTAPLYFLSRSSPHEIAVGRALRPIFDLAVRKGRFYLELMRRACRTATLTLLLFSLAFASSANAQGLQVEVEEFRRLAGEIADLREANQAQQRRITNLQNEVQSLRTALRDASEKSATKMGEFVTREDLKSLVESIRQVDEKRDADKRLILEEISKLGKVLSAPTRAAPEREQPSRPAPAIEETVIPYKVQKGDFLSTIVASYNASLREKGLPRITLDDVKRVNPKININQIYEGQELLLPVPEKGK